MPELTVLVPAYNEEDNLDPLLEELTTTLQTLERSYEIIIIDDGSSDGSARRLEELAKQYHELRPVLLKRRAGQTAAVVAGLESARGETIVTLDADLQNNPADIPRLLEKLETHDVVCGVRRLRRDGSLRRLSGWIANATLRHFLGASVTDVGCSLKAFRKSDLERLVRFDGMHRFLPVLLEWEGCRVVEIDVDHRPRRAGTSKYNVRNRLFRGLADLAGVRWMKARRLRYEIKS